jgi:choline dehydrogenase-like flavoprotein
MLQVTPRAQVHDVVVIGSGAGGGTVARVLTSKGVKVTMLEAGPMLNPAKDYKEHKTPYDYDHRGAGEAAEHYTGKMQWGYFAAPNGYWDMEGEPYTTAEGTQFRWFRSRILGGRTNHYGRISLRFSDYDFKPRSFDGLGADWPITYDEVAPYYDLVEEFIGVTGSHEGIRTAPDGKFMPCPSARVHERMVRDAAAQMGIKAIPARLAIITRNHNGRAACHYCGQCGRGCVTASNYSSSQVDIFPALKTGNLNLICNAMVRELITDDEGRVKAVSYIDTQTREERTIRCRVCVVAASACESARLLLNSKSSRHPNGLANGSGVVGRYLMDTVGRDMAGYIPSLEGLPKYDTDGMGGGHLYIPWWGLEDKKKNFPRGYHVEIGGGFNMPMLGSFYGTCSRHQGFGKDLKKAIRREYGCYIGLSGRGEMIPNEKSYCEIDPKVVDRWGIPVLRFHFEWSEHELNQARHMENIFAEIFDRLGGKLLGARKPELETPTISVPGAIIHELGTVRMGDDPRTSALNKYSQAHEVKNLFVADAAPFVSNPDKNPTLTICALAWRMSDYLAEEMRNGNI